MSQFKHTTPPALQTIVERALAKDPQQRYPHALALLAALEAVPPPAAAGAPLSPPSSTGLTTEMTSMPATPSPSLPIEAFDTLIMSKKALRDRSGGDQALPENGTIYAYLDLEQADAPARRIPIKEKYVIVGRLDPKRGIKPEIDLTPFDPQATVSRQHARIRFEKTFFYIEDLKSRNKTRLGELTLAPLKPELLQHGDTVWFGSLKMVFRIPGMPDVPKPQTLP